MRGVGVSRASLALGLAGLFVMLVGVSPRAEARRPAPASKAVRPAATAKNKARIRGAFAKLPLSFEANQGQTDRRVKFLARGTGYGIFLTPGQTVLRLRSGRPDFPSAEKRAGKARIAHAPKVPAYRVAVVRLKLAGANQASASQGQQPLPGKANYLIGSDPSKWHRNVPTFSKVRFAKVYPGIDQVFYGNQRQLEYDFVVAPGADPSKIRVHVSGADRMSLDKNGNLVLATHAGPLVQAKPYVYQEVNGVRKQVAGGYVLRKDEVGFQVARYDAARPLVIDPTLGFATLVGGSGIDTGAAIAVDSSGNPYITGYTESADFPTTAGALDTTFNDPSPIGATAVRPQQVLPGADAYVTKLNSTGTARTYSTYLGGSGNDFGNAIAVDAAGAAYVTGTSDSPDFPFAIPTGTAAARRGGAHTQGTPELFFDAFVTEINATGSDVVFSGFVGGSDFDEGRGISIDPTSGDVAVAGVTFSDDFFTTDGAFDNTYNGAGDAFLAIIFADGSDLAYATFIGGTDYDEGNDVAVDSLSSSHVVGTTFSDDFFVNPGDFGPTSGGGGDAFAVNIVPSSDNPATGAEPNDPTDLFYAGFLGGADFDEGLSVAVFTGDIPYIAGATFSTDFPTTAGAFSTTNSGSGDAYLTLLNATGTAVTYSTFLGGAGQESASLERGGGNGKSIGVAVDGAGNAYVAGTTFSADFPVTADATQGTLGGDGDAFLAQINPIAGGTTDLIFATFLGGTGFDQGNDVAVPLGGTAGTAASTVCIVGTTFSTDFPTTAGTVGTTLGGTEDAFVACYNMGGVGPPPECSGDIRRSPSIIRFQKVPVGNTRRRNFTIHNVSTTEDLVITDISEPDDPFFVDLPDLPFTLGPGETRTIRVEFSPGRPRGVHYRDTITIFSSDCDKADGISVTLRGMAVRRRGNKGGGGHGKK